MNRTIVFATFALWALAGCMAGAPRPGAQAQPPAGSDTAPTGAPLGSPFADRRMAPGQLTYPLMLDPTAMRFGTTVQYARIPTVSELNDLRATYGIQQLILSLPAWPASFEALSPLEQVSQDFATTIIVPGYPPSRQAAEAWNMLRVPLRLVVVVNDTPTSSIQVDDLNNLRALERVIAQVDTPNRAGFERLQRPLSFRVLRE
jgi:hypothetical protein